MTTPLAAGNIVEIDNLLTAYLPTNALRTITTFTATAAQTTFTVTYTQGLIEVFYNGSNLAQSEYTATNGTTVVLATACQLNDIVVVYAYSYSVGAYSGIGGSGTSGYHAKFTGTNTIGNGLIYDDGTSLFIGNGQSSATPQTAIIEGTDGSGTNIAGAEFRIQGGQGTGTGVGGDLTFYTAPVGTAGSSLNTAVERMRITTAGNVGIGTTNATSPLSIYYPSTSADVNYIKMEMPSWGGSANYKKNIIWHDSGNVVGAIGMSFTSPYTYMDFHSFYNSAHTTSTIMRIQGNGLIGIGTTAPSFRLSFGGDTATTIGMNQSTLGTAPALTLKGADSPAAGTNNEGGPIYISSGLGTGNGATSNIIFSTGATLGSGGTRQTLTERMRITAAGNVGIGTSSPTVSQTGGGLALGDGTAQKGIRFNVESGGWGYIEYYEASTAKWITGFRSADGTYNIKTGTNLSTGNGISIANTGITTINNTLILGTSTFVGDIQWGTSGYGTSGYNAGNGKFTWLSAAGAVAGTIYYSFNADGGGAKMTLTNNGNLYAAGTISAGGTKSFLIPHPLTNLKETHNLRHTSVESPQADLIYRGKLTLINGKAQANIDEVSTMTEGTFEALCREVQCFTTNESGWDLVKGKVIGNIIYIESQNQNSTDEISWMVIGERKDDYMYEGDITDENGKVIVEPLKPIEPAEPAETIEPIEPIVEQI
jgi:hypothetical protein